MLHYTASAVLDLLTAWSLWGNPGWLGVERCQLCLLDTSLRAVGHWVSLCV